MTTKLSKEAYIYESLFLNTSLTAHEAKHAAAEMVMPEQTNGIWSPEQVHQMEEDVLSTLSPDREKIVRRQLMRYEEAILEEVEQRMKQLKAMN